MRLRNVDLFYIYAKLEGTRSVIMLVTPRRPSLKKTLILCYFKLFHDLWSLAVKCSCSPQNLRGTQRFVSAGISVRHA